MQKKSCLGGKIGFATELQKNKGFPMEKVTKVAPAIPPITQTKLAVSNRPAPAFGRASPRGVKLAKIVTNIEATIITNPIILARSIKISHSTNLPILTSNSERINIGG